MTNFNCEICGQTVPKCYKCETCSSVVCEACYKPNPFCKKCNGLLVKHIEREVRKEIPEADLVAIINVPDHPKRYLAIQLLEVYERRKRHGTTGWIAQHLSGLTRALLDEPTGEGQEAARKRDEEHKAKLRRKFGSTCENWRDPPK